MTESILRDLYFDKAFIGTNAIDEDRGVMTPSYVEAAKKRIVRENSNKAYVLCDSSKFHQSRMFARLGSMVCRLSRSPMTRRSPSARA